MFGTRRFAWFAVVLCVVASSIRSRAAAADTLFRVGFSSSMFADVNENDAKAAVKAWGQTVARERGIPTDPEPLILKDQAALLDALRSNRVDAVGMTTVEFGALKSKVEFAPIFVTYNSGRTAEQYVLLAHQDSKIKTVDDLRGRSLMVHLNPRVCLAPLWLDTLLMQKGLPTAARFVGKITQNSKLAKVALPVFFRQSDACLVTRSGFEMMAELNPQVGKQLKVVASSPEMVPAVLAFRANYDPAFKERLFSGVRDLHKTPAGQQVLTIFHSEKIEDQPASCLASALELMATHARLCGEAKAAKAPDESLPQAATQGGSL